MAGHFPPGYGGDTRDDGIGNLLVPAVVGMAIGPHIFDIVVDGRAQSQEMDSGKGASIHRLPDVFEDKDIVLGRDAKDGMVFPVKVLDFLQERYVILNKRPLRRLHSGGEIVGSQIDDGDIRLGPSLVRMPVRGIGTVESLDIARGHIVLRNLAVIVPGNPHPGMGGYHLVGPEIPGRSASVGQVLVLRFGREAFLVGGFRPISAGVGVANEFNDPFCGGIGLEKHAVRDKFLKGRATHPAFGPLLQDKLMHAFGFPPGRRKQGDGGVLAEGGDDLVRSLVHPVIYPDIVIVLAAVRQLYAEAGSLKLDPDVNPGPVKGYGRAFGKRPADICHPAVRRRNGFAPGLETAQ